MVYIFLLFQKYKETSQTAKLIVHAHQVHPNPASSPTRSTMLYLYKFSPSCYFPFAFHKFSHLPVRHHVADAAEVLGGQLFFELLARQPLKVGVAEGAALDVGLAGHDAAAEEEGLGALFLDGTVLGEDGLVDEVGDGDAADDPGVHVDAGGLIEDSLGGLWRELLDVFFLTLGVVLSSLPGCYYLPRAGSPHRRGRRQGSPSRPCP